MSGDNRKPPDPIEQKLIGRLRAISIAVILGLIVVDVLLDAFVRAFLNPDFHVEDVFFATLVGALLTLLIGESITRVRP